MSVINSRQRNGAPSGKMELCMSGIEPDAPPRVVVPEARHDAPRLALGGLRAQVVELAEAADAVR